MHLRILLVQVKVARPDTSVMDRISHIEKLIKNTLDARSQSPESNPGLILLPETTFCSYCQRGPAEAKQLAEEQEAIVKEWGRTTATHLNAYLAFGYIGMDKQKNVPINALAVFAPNGELIRDQKKRFLYASDEVWTKECEDSFQAITLSMLPGAPRVMFAICNDINAKTFDEDDMNSFPLANAVKDQNATVLCLSAAWCSAHPESPNWAHDEEIRESSQISYWVERLAPLVGKKYHFVCADLVGREAIPNKTARIRYCGTSCCIDLEKPSLACPHLSTSSEGCLFVSIPLQLPK